MKKIISLLLTVTLLLSLFSVSMSVSAEEVTIYKEFALSYTRDVMESRTAFLTDCVTKNDADEYVIKEDAWELPGIAAVCDGFDSVFDEVTFMKDDKYGFGVTEENGYRSTLNGIPHQFGVIKSAVNGVADEPGNVIHSADFEGDINIPVDEAPYNSLYMIAWSGWTHNVAATITYNYTDGTTSTDANITTIWGGKDKRDETDYVKKLPKPDDNIDYVPTWRRNIPDATEKSVGARNIRMFQHILTPDSTKILESVTITTKNEELNIFSITGATSSSTVTTALDAIKARFENEELTREQLAEIEAETEILVGILEDNGIASTYEEEIAALVDARIEEIVIEETTITEFDIMYPFNLTYTRDVMESKTEFQQFVVKETDGTYSISEDAWSLPSSAAVCDGYPSVFNEDNFMSESIGLGANANNNYRSTIYDIVYQFGVLESSTHGVANEPNVIHSADFEGDINIPVDEAPYNNLYMIAWSGATHNVASTITYNYTDGTTSTDANITTIWGGTGTRTETDYVKKLPNASRDYMETWRTALKTTSSNTIGTRNVRVFQHKLTPDSTKVLESVSITTAGEEINIFAITGTTTSMVVKAKLDEIVNRFATEELTEEELVLIEEDTKILIDILKSYDIKPTYEAQIATLVAERRAEIREEERTEDFDTATSTPIELNLFEDAFMGYDEYLNNVANGAAEGSPYLYKGFQLDTRVLKAVSYPQSASRGGGTVAMVFENTSYTGNAKTTIESQVEAGKLVAGEDGRYDFTVAGTTYHLGEIAEGKKGGNVFFPGQKYVVPSGETLSSVYTQDASTNKVTSATYNINKSGLASVNILAATFKNQVALHTANAHDYASGEGRTELLPVTVTYSDGTSELFYLVAGSTYVDFYKAIRVADKGAEVENDTVSLYYTGGSKSVADLVPVGTSSNIGVDYLGEIFEINGKKLLMPQGGEILASINRITQAMNDEGEKKGYSTGNGFTYSYEVPVSSTGSTVASVTIDNPVSLDGYGFEEFFGEEDEDIVVGTSGTTYLKFASDDTSDYYLAIYGENDSSGSANNWTGIFAMTAEGASLNDVLAELEAEAASATPDIKKLKDLLSILEEDENFSYDLDLSETAKGLLNIYKSGIVITEENSKITGTITLKTAQSGVGVIAFYDEEGDLISTVIQNVSDNTTIEVGEKPLGTVTVKGFIWTDLISTMIPLATTK